MSVQTIILLIILGLAAGILSGLVGVGGGIIVVPALVFFMAMTQHQAQGTSLGLLLLPAGLLAVMNYYKQGYIDIKIVLILFIGFFIGGYFGSKIALKIDQQMLKKIFAVVLFYTGFKMLGWDAAIFRWVKSIF